MPRGSRAPPAGTARRAWLLVAERLPLRPALARACAAAAITSCGAAFILAAAAASAAQAEPAAPRVIVAGCALGAGIVLALARRATPAPLNQAAAASAASISAPGAWAPGSGAGSGAWTLAVGLVGLCLAVLCEGLGGVGAFLRSAFLHPPWFSRALTLTPVALLAACYGAALTSCLRAQAWLVRRTLNDPAGPAALWSAIALGAVLGAVAVGWVPASIAALVGPAAVFLGAAVWSTLSALDTSPVLSGESQARDPMPGRRMSHPLPRSN